MIHQNDILVFVEIIDRGDDRCVIVAMEDEYVREGTPRRASSGGSFLKGSGSSPRNCISSTR